MKRQRVYRGALKWLLPASGTLIAILGITALFAPMENLAKLAALIGAAMLLAGIPQIGFFFWNEMGARSRIALACGILSASFGVWTWLGGGATAQAGTLTSALAVLVIARDIARVFLSLSLKAGGSSLWAWILAFGIVGAALGALLLIALAAAAIATAAAIAAAAAAAVPRLLAFMFIAHGTNSITIFFGLYKACDI